MGVTDSQVDQHASAEWRVALDEFARWQDRAGRWRGVVGEAAVLLFVTPLVIQNIHYIWYALALLVGFPLAVKLWRRWQQAHRPASGADRLPAYQRKLLEQLESSDLAQRLLAGQLSGNEPAGYVAPALRWLVPPLAPAERVRILRRVLTWQDWYLGPPRRSVNKYWLMLAGFTGLPLMISFMGAFDRDFGQLAQGLGLYLFFVSLTCQTYEYESSTFLSYLHKAWLSPETVDTAGAASLPAEQQLAALQQTRQTQLIINQAQQDMDRSRGMFHVLAMMVVVLGLMPVVLSEFNYLYLLLLPMVVVLPMLTEQTKLWAGYRAQLQEQLAASALGPRLAAGECRGPELAQHVAPPWRMFLQIPSPPAGYADELRRQFWRVAFNLDWYLAPPRPLFRFWWLALVAQVICLLAVMGYLVAAATSAYALTLPAPWPAWIVGYACLLTLLSLPASLHAVRVSIWIDELAAYLRSSCEE